jgi:hypothetical protein
MVRSCQILHRGEEWHVRSVVLAQLLQLVHAEIQPPADCRAGLDSLGLVAREHGVRLKLGQIDSQALRQPVPPPGQPPLVGVTVWPRGRLRVANQDHGAGIGKLLFQIERASSQLPSG